jgi:aryl-alcohol dehydrogenase-like predicted oxidoreductase
VRAVGTSNFRAWETSAAVARQRALGRPAFTATQLYYSLVAREAEHELIPECRADDLGVIVWSPLSSGFLTGRYRGAGSASGGGRRTTFTFPPVDPEWGERALVALEAVADGRGATMAQVALAWVLAQPGITSAIVGASSLEQLDDNLAAAELELTADELAALDAATALAPIYPAWWDPAMGIPGPTDHLETDPRRSVT